MKYATPPLYEHVHKLLPTHRSPTHPGDMLLSEFLEPMGMTQAEFARRVRISYVRLNEIVHARRGVTADTALRFARFLGTTADFWLGLQTSWDLYHAIHSPGAAEIEAIEPMQWEDDGDGQPQADAIRGTEAAPVPARRAGL